MINEKFFGVYICPSLRQSWNDVVSEKMKIFLPQYALVPWYSVNMPPRKRWWKNSEIETIFFISV